MNLKNKKWSEDQFLEVRKEVLCQWPTGAEVDLLESVEYLKNLPKEKNFAKRLLKARGNHETLLQPRAGVALVEDQIELLRYLQNEGGADLLPTTIDSYTRQNRFNECESGIVESRKAGRSMLNGFPAVNHGVYGCRKLLESVDLPIQARHGTPDARLLSEIIHAGGWTSNEGGGISYNIPYAKSATLEKSIYDWQYCDRLAGYYQERNIDINREPFGPLTGTLVPPGISNAIAIIEGLLAAEQGVKHITLGYGQCGNLTQDVAAMRALEEQALEYFREYGYDVQLTTVFHQWMGGFPEDEAKAFGVISWGAATAALSGATKVIVKSIQEAVGIPTREANAQGMKATREVLNLLNEQKLSMSKDVASEMLVIEDEVKCLLDAVLETGEGDLAVGVVNAFKYGILDIPFAPSIYNAGKILPARDVNGAVRYLSYGNLPISGALKEYNDDLLQQRACKEHRDVNFQLVIDDIFAVSTGSLVGNSQRV
ncbi:methylaspartate mutase subunit E [Clostridia bacterium]|nr:methylaspartate mutase subunit E [Clostridia bacterium]